MSVWHVLEVEGAIAVGVFGFAYGMITLVLWALSRDSDRRQRERSRGDASRSGTC